MLSLRPGVAGLFCALALSAVACATRAPVTTKVAPAPAPVATAPVSPATAPVADPVAELIAVSTRHFEDGQRSMQAGHLLSAKAEFDRALEGLMDTPAGARSEPRLREHFDRLVERISAYEVMALALGDGFAEQKAEPATIDDLLAISTFEEPVPTKETKLAVATDLQSVTYDIDIPQNSRVLKYVELFSGRLKGFLEEGLSRGARYLPMVQEVFRAEGLPLDLAYVPLVESAFKPSALSRAKARGIWQFMRGTALENGLKHDWYLDERADPEKATRAAANYLRTLYGMFGDWHLALASYNGGPGRVQRSMKRSRRDDFWAISSTTRYLPRETRDYVPLILAAVIVARNPVHYGLNIEPFDEPRFETVTLPTAVDLRRIAEWIDVPVQAIQDLNPELRRWTTPLRATDYSLKVPEGSADLVRARLAETNPDELAPLNRHTVRKGETIVSIAKKLKVSRADLAEANYLSAKSRLNAGQQLIVPRPPALLVAARADDPAPALEIEQPDPVVARAAIPVEPAATERTKLTHRVKRGDTLFSIARLYRTTVDLLRQWNGIRGSGIRVGQRLTIFRTLATS